MCTLAGTTVECQQAGSMLLSTRVVSACALVCLAGVVGRGTTTLTGAGLSSVQPSAGKAQVGEWGLDFAAMDKWFSPGEEFYSFVNPTWLQTTEIPPDLARFGEFARFAEVNANRNRGIVGKAASAPSTPEERQVGDFYASLVDLAAREAAGIAPLTPQLERVAAIATARDLARALAEPNRDWLRPLPGGATAMRNVGLQDWKDYLAFGSIGAFAPYGPRDLAGENFDFELRALSDTPDMAGPWMGGMRRLRLRPAHGCTCRRRCA
jgi:predicted metalloendopeptidase